MKKILVFALFLGFAGFASAENYSFPAGKMNDVDIVIKSGTLNVKSAKGREVVVNVTPDKSADTQRRIYLFKEGRKLKAFFNDEDITAETVVNITLPKNIELDIEAYNANINIEGMQNDIEIEAVNSKIEIKDFNGSFDLKASDTSVNAQGLFKEVDIKASAGSNVELTMSSLPAWYDYEFKGNGSVIINLPEGKKDKNLKLDTKEFYGNIDIK